jgi:hypothetical protein
MRDRSHESYSKFHIELEKRILGSLQKLGTRRNCFSQTLSLEFRPCELHQGIGIHLPVNFRLLRVLSIIHWWFPEELRVLVHLELEREKFTWLNDEQRIEISLYLDSKESTVKYLFLTERYTSSEIFGNLLGNDLRALGRRKIIRWEKYPYPRKKVYRRGPKDHGARRQLSRGPHYEEDVQRDWTLNQEEHRISQHELLLQRTSNRILTILRKSDLE